MFELKVIPHHLLIQVWPIVEPYFKRIVRDNPEEFTLLGIQGRLLDKQESLAVVVDENDNAVGAFTLKIHTMDTGLKAMLLPMLGGDNAADWLEDTIGHLKKLADAEGCYQVWCLGCRHGWSRMVGSHVLKAPPGKEGYTLKFIVGDYDVRK